MIQIKELKKGLVLHLRLLLLLILFHPAAKIFGQSILLKAGMNASSVAGVPEKTALIGYHVGIGGIKDVSGKLALKSELIFSQQGTKITDDERLIYYYLNMPILLNAHLGNNFFFNVGPQVGLALKALEKRESDRDITANLNVVDVSACMGVNYLISERLLVEGRVNVGITDLSRISVTERYRNTVLQGSVGYYFNRKSQQSE